MSNWGRLKAEIMKMVWLDAGSPVSDLYIGGAVSELGDHPRRQLAAALGEALVAAPLAVVMRLPALPRHHLLLHRDHRHVQQLRDHVQ